MRRWSLIATCIALAAFLVGTQPAGHRGSLPSRPTAALSATLLPLDLSPEKAAADHAAHESASALLRRARATIKHAEHIVQSPLPPPPPPVPPAGTCAEWIRAAHITDPSRAYFLATKESGCRPWAKNPRTGACGIPQANPCGKLGDAFPNKPVAQLVWMQGYVMGRYGSWSNAVGFWLAHGWY